MDIVTITPRRRTCYSCSRNVEAGEGIILARCRTPDRQAHAVRPSRQGRTFGARRGIVRVGSKFFKRLQVMRFEVTRLDRPGDMIATLKAIYPDLAGDAAIAKIHLVVEKRGLVSGRLPRTGWEHHS
jgi:hypothetical protein